MPRPTTLTFTFATADANGICTSQTATATGGSNLTINGALATGGVATMDAPRHVSITATGNNSTKTFTFTGTDRFGTAITEALSGPTGGLVAGTKNFSTVTNVAIDAASAGAVIVGSANAAETQWIPLNRYTPEKSITVDLTATASLTYGVQWTNDDVQASGFQENDATAFADGTITGKSADFMKTDSIPARALRVAVTGHSAGGGTITVVQES